MKIMKRFCKLTKFKINNDNDENSDEFKCTSDENLTSESKKSSSKKKVNKNNNNNNNVVQIQRSISDPLDYKLIGEKDNESVLNQSSNSSNNKTCDNSGDNADEDEDDNDDDRIYSKINHNKSKLKSEKNDTSNRNLSGNKVKRVPRSSSAIAAASAAVTMASDRDCDDKAENNNNKKCPVNEKSKCKKNVDDEEDEQDGDDNDDPDDYDRDRDNELRNDKSETKEFTHSNKNSNNSNKYNTGACNDEKKKFSHKCLSNDEKAITSKTNGNSKSNSNSKNCSNSKIVKTKSDKNNNSSKHKDNNKKSKQNYSKKSTSNNNSSNNNSKCKDNTVITETNHLETEANDENNENSNAITNTNSNSNQESDSYQEEYDEIDQIYDYIRGLAPLPEKIRQQLANDSYNNDLHQSEQCKLPKSKLYSRPEPPPIETIPSGKQRRLSYPLFIHDISMNNVKKYDHIYEKIGKNRVYTSRVPMRSISVSKICLPCNSSYYQYQAYQQQIPLTQQQKQQQQEFLKQQQQQLKQQQKQQEKKAKLFIKSQSGQTKGNRLFKYSNKNQKLIQLNQNKDLYQEYPVLQQQIFHRYPYIAYPSLQQQHEQQTQQQQQQQQQQHYQRLSPNSFKVIVDKDNHNQTYCTSLTSPLFNIRYKSLNNLHFIPTNVSNIDYTNTLESSNSGGHISGSGSGLNEFKNGDNKNFLYKYPKAKTRKISRPLSLTNLFWDLSNGNKSLTSDNSNNYNKLNLRKLNSKDDYVYIDKIPNEIIKNNSCNKIKSKTNTNSNQNKINFFSSVTNSNTSNNNNNSNINNNNNNNNNNSNNNSNSLIYNLNPITAEKQKRFSTLYL